MFKELIRRIWGGKDNCRDRHFDLTWLIINRFNLNAMLCETLRCRQTRILCSSRWYRHCCTGGDLPLVDHLRRRSPLAIAHTDQSNEGASSWCELESWEDSGFSFGVIKCEEQELKPVVTLIYRDVVVNRPSVSCKVSIFILHHMNRIYLGQRMLELLST